MARTSVEAREPISKVTMPLFAHLNDRAEICATGVLLKIGQKHFILTAAHVFDKWKTTPIPLNITDGVPGNLLFGIGEVTLRRSPTAQPQKMLRDDPYDTCVCDISQATADRIAAGNRFRFLELSEIDPWDKQDHRSWYMVFGFPGELNKTDPMPKVLGSNAAAYATLLYLGERGSIPWKEADRGVGILMDYGPNTTRDDSGQIVKSPNPRGMSGGGMWRLVEYGTDINDWSTKSVKLIGIQSAVCEPQHVLRGTRIEHAIGFIYRGHDDLRPEIERHYGEEECKRRFA